MRTFLRLKQNRSKPIQCWNQMWNLIGGVTGYLQTFATPLQEEDCNINCYFCATSLLIFNLFWNQNWPQPDMSNRMSDGVVDTIDADRNAQMRKHFIVNIWVILTFICQGVDLLLLHEFCISINIKVVFHFLFSFW